MQAPDGRKKELPFTDWASYQRYIRTLPTRRVVATGVVLWGFLLYVLVVGQPLLLPFAILGVVAHGVSLCARYGGPKHDR